MSGTARRVDPAALVHDAARAREAAYAPYSGYRVGAAVLTAGGEVFTGANVENASYGLTCCAERVAAFAAASRGHTSFSAVAVVAEGAEPPVPCGACLQVLAEFSGPDLPVIAANAEGETRVRRLGDFLPMPFGPGTMRRGG